MYACVAALLGIAWLNSPSNNKSFNCLYTSAFLLLDDLSKVYDYIRMLDCDGYPKAFLESNKLKFEFSNVKFTSKNELKANVSISKK
mgnify:CR=1 FL=1